MATPPQPTPGWVRRHSSCDYSSDPFVAWCCELKNETGPVRTGSGIIVELPDLERGLDYLRNHFPGLHKVSDKICTKYALITCHHTIPGFGYTQGWTVSFCFGKKQVRLENHVVGAVSCCGGDSVITPLHPETCGTLEEHPNKYCDLRLDFTIFFLNTNFKSTIVVSCTTPQSGRKSCPSPPQLTLHKLPDLKAILSMTDGALGKACPSASACTDPGKSATQSSISDEDVVPFHLYHRQHDLQQVIQMPIRIEKCKDALLLQPGLLRHQVEVHKRFQKIFYYSRHQEEIKTGYSGSPIVCCSPGSPAEAPQLLGIHVGENTDNDGYESGGYIGVSIYAILQLLQGQLPACLSLMRHAQPRRIWASKWAHLLQCQIANQRVKMNLGYLVEILNLLLEKHLGTQLIALRITDPLNEITAALNLLSTLFKRFENSGHGDVAAAIEGDTAENKKGGVLGANQKEAFIANVRGLCQSMLDLLTNVENDRDRVEEGVVKACFHCWNMMLNFKYKRLVEEMFHTGDGLSRLGRLRDKYSDCTEILKDFGDIHVKCRLFLLSQHEQQYMALKGEIQQRQQHVEQLDKKKEEARAMCQRENTRMREMLDELKDEKEQLLRQVDALQEEKETEIQQLRTNIQTLQGEKETEIQQLRTNIQTLQEEKEAEIRQLRTNIQTLQEEKDTEIRQLRTNIQTLQEENNRAEATSQQHRQRTASLRARTDRLKDQLAAAGDEKKQLERQLDSERKVADYRAKQQEQSVQKLNKELKESRQSILTLNQQLQALKAENESLQNELKKNVDKTRQSLEQIQSGQAEEDLGFQQEDLTRELKAKDKKLEMTEKQLEDSKKELEAVRKELEAKGRELEAERRKVEQEKHP